MDEDKTCSDGRGHTTTRIFKTQYKNYDQTEESGGDMKTKVVSYDHWTSLRPDRPCQECKSNWFVCICVVDSFIT